MNDSQVLIVDFVTISGGFWGIFGFYYMVKVHLFIEKRYREETDLLNTIYFKEHYTFASSLPILLSAMAYVTHLTSFIWGWNYFKKKKPFRDIKNADEVLRYFSNKEIRRVKRFLFCGVLFILHAMAFQILKIIWPDAFS